MYQKFEQASFQTFKQQYQNNLKSPSCLIPCLEELCGGWTQETLKSILQKVTKKNQAPMPLFYDSSAAMDAISNKRQALAQVFQHFDTRGIGRIDATELFACMLFLSKGDLSQIFYNIATMYGSDRTTYITSDEFFFFLDSLFRGISKVLICKNETKPIQVNKRLNDADISKFIQQIFKGENKINKDELFKNVAQVTTLYEFLYNIYTHMQSSLEYARDEALKMMKITLEVKKVMALMLIEIDKKSKK